MKNNNIIRELCKEIGSDKELENSLNILTTQLLAENLSSEDRKAVIQCTNYAIERAYDLKNKQLSFKQQKHENNATWKLILAGGICAFLILAGGGVFVRQLKVA